MNWRLVFAMALLAGSVGCGRDARGGCARGAVCTDTDAGPIAVDGGSRPPMCNVASATVRTSAIDTVDVLFMVDNSNSMAEEQASLVVQFPQLVNVLTTGDRNADGVPDFPPVRDLHVGVITSDMGHGGFPIPTCTTTTGDDGVLITRGSAGSGCMATYPPYLGFMPPGDATRFAADFSCVARVGTGGCGFEQQLEATLKAITPATSSIRFHMGTSGHAEAANAGFLRPDSLAVVILATDEEDCSLSDPALLELMSSRYPGDLNLRCFTYPDAVHPVARFVDGFRAVRPADPELFLFAAITGVPIDLVGDPTRVDYAAILADPRMQEVVDTSGTRLTPSCNVPGRGLAFPPRRIVSVAQALEPNAVVQSICQDDFGPAIDALTERIANSLARVCLPRALNVLDASGRVGCEITDVLPGSGAVTRCDQVPGHTFVRMSDTGLGEPAGRQVCRVAQVPGGAGDGWYYDQTPGAECPSATPQRIAFAGSAAPPSGSNVRLECLDGVQTPPGAPSGDCRVTSACGTVSIGGMPLACDANTGSCQLRCTTNADCASLPTFVCDTSPASPLSSPACVNPACR